MSLSYYTGKKAAVAGIQRRLDEQLNTIRNNRSYSDSGRKSEMAKRVLVARAEMNKMKSNFAAERQARGENLHRIVFGNTSGATAAELIADRDARDRAGQLSTLEDANAMLRRANQNGDESLAKAVAEAAFNRGWTDVARDYADQVGKRERSTCSSRQTSARKPALPTRRCSASEIRKS